MSIMPPSLFLDSSDERKHEIFMINPQTFVNIFWKSFLSLFSHV